MRPLSPAEREQAATLASMLEELTQHLRTHQLPGWLMAQISGPVRMVLHVCRGFLARAQPREERDDGRES